jgi:hypothetical protein
MATSCLHHFDTSCFVSVAVHRIVLEGGLAPGPVGPAVHPHSAGTSHDLTLGPRMVRSKRQVIYYKVTLTFF